MDRLMALGKIVWPRFSRRKPLFKLSMALVVYMTFRAVCENLNMGLMQSQLSLQWFIKAMQEITGIHWDTIHRIYREMMDEALGSRAEELHKDKYKPMRLAVDEFAIHKGHTYATCVMDLDKGDVIWAGKGRSKEDFKHFFEDMPEGYLSDVVAVAMDMNASYNILFTEKLSKAVIAYDRYHMQVQYGKDVLGTVRLQEARKHQIEAKSILKTAESLDDPEQKRRLKAEAREEKQRYSQLNRLRWTLLTNGAKPSDEKA